MTAFMPATPESVKLRSMLLVPATPSSSALADEQPSSDEIAAGGSPSRSRALAEKLFDRAYAHHCAGEAFVAEDYYRRAIQMGDVAPDVAIRAKYNFGVFWRESRRLDLAVSCFQEVAAAVEIDRKSALWADLNLGEIFLVADQLAAAERCLRRVLDFPEFQPRATATAHCNLGVLLKQAERFAEAEANFREAMKQKDAFPEVGAMAESNLGQLCAAQRRLKEAAEHFQAVIELKQSAPEAAARAEYSFGMMCVRFGYLDDGEAHYLAATKLSAAAPETAARAEFALGVFYRGRRQLADAATHYRAAMAMSAAAPDAALNSAFDLGVMNTIIHLRDNDGLPINAEEVARRDFSQLANLVIDTPSAGVTKAPGSSPAAAANNRSSPVGEADDDIVMHLRAFGTAALNANHQEAARSLMSALSSARARGDNVLKTLEDVIIQAVTNNESMSKHTRSPSNQGPSAEAGQNSAAAELRAALANLSARSASDLPAKPRNKLKEVREAFFAQERATIRAALEKNGWVQTYAAKELGTSFTSLKSALRRHPDLREEASRNARPGRPLEKQEK